MLPGNYGTKKLYGSQFCLASYVRMTTPRFDRQMELCLKYNQPSSE